MVRGGKMQAGQENEMKIFFTKIAKQKSLILVLLAICDENIPIIYRL